MTDQTVRVERDDVAIVAERLARDLWYEETGKRPKASDAKFMLLVSVCAMSLMGRMNPNSSLQWLEKHFPQN